MSDDAAIVGINRVEADDSCYEFDDDILPYVYLSPFRTSLLMVCIE